MRTERVSHGESLAAQSHGKNSVALESEYSEFFSMGQNALSVVSHACSLGTSASTVLSGRV